MTTPQEPPQEAAEGANTCAPTLISSDRNRAAMDRLWARQHALAEQATEARKVAARTKTAARARKYREARRSAALAARAEGRCRV